MSEQMAREYAAFDRRVRALSQKARKTLAAEQMYEALRAVWAYGSHGETEEGISVSYLVAEALRAAGFYEETK